MVSADARTTIVVPQKTSRSPPSWSRAKGGAAGSTMQERYAGGRPASAVRNAADDSVDTPDAGHPAQPASHRDQCARCSSVSGVEASAA
ncbi:hypothetical protein GCM10027451_10270 [Geodermatophilus aquaeductus]